MKKIILIGLILIVSFSYNSLAKDKYAIKLRDGKIESYQLLSEEYLKKFASDPSCPLQQGFFLVDSLEGYEFYEPPLPPTEKEKFLAMLDDEDIKTKIKNIKKDEEPVMMTSRMTKFKEGIYGFYKKARTIFNK